MASRTILRTAVLGALAGAAGVVLGRVFGAGDHAPREPGEGAGVREGEGAIRNAGPEATRTAPRRAWDAEDQASDESFPASDPPGQGVG